MIPEQKAGAIISNLNDRSLNMKEFLKIIDDLLQENKISSDYFNEKLVWPARERLLEEIKLRISNHSMAEIKPKNTI